MKIVDKEYLSFAGVNLKLNFYWTKDILGSDKLISDIRKHWNKFLSRSKNNDIEINFKEFPLKIYTNKNEQYFLGVQRTNIFKRINIHYFTSIKILDVLFREIINNSIEKDGFILHSSAVSRNKDTCYLFLAKSGGGKSTTANNLENKYKKIADDSTVIRKLPVGWTIYSSPFVEKQKLPVNFTFRNVIIFNVHKSKKCYARPIQDNFKKVKIITGALWLNYATISPIKLKNILLFCHKFSFYDLYANLNKKQLMEVIDDIQN